MMTGLGSPDFTDLEAMSLGELREHWPGKPPNVTMKVSVRRSGGRATKASARRSIRASYCASKAGVAMLTRSLAVEWASSGVRVNCIAPGYADTALLQSLAAEGKVDLAALTRRTPSGKLTRPEDVAETVGFLCDPRSRHITGQVLAVDGGWTSYGYI